MARSRPDDGAGRAEPPRKLSIDDNQSVDESAEATGEWAAAAPTPNPTANMPSRAKPRLSEKTGSAHGAFSLFSAVSHSYRDGRQTNAVPRAAAPKPTRVITTVNEPLPRSASRCRSASGSTSTPRTMISNVPQSSAVSA